jgi:PAS domain S-box-containing protein
MRKGVFVVGNATGNRAICANGDEPSDPTTRKSKTSRFSSVRVRVLIPLSVALVVVLGGFGWASYSNQKRKQDERCDILRNAVSAGLRAELNREAGTIIAALEAVSWNTELRAEMLDGNTEALYERAKPLFDQIRRQNRITHFYFLSPERVCLLRVHQPARHGDKIDRFTVKEAERTGKTAHGIELGPLGTFTLRVVRPWYDNGRLIGYIEMGEEIEHVTEHLSEAFDVDFCILIKKQLLDKPTWTEGMLMLGREADWHRLPSKVIVSHSLTGAPEALSKSATPGEVDGESFEFETSISGRNYAVCSIELRDAAGQNVGDMVLLRDLTAEQAAHFHTVFVGAVVCLAVSAILFGAFYFYLGRVDTALGQHTSRLAAANADLEIEISNSAATERELQAVRDNLSAVLEAIPDSFMVIDLDHRIVLANETVRKLAGGIDPVAAGLRCHQVSHHRDTPCTGLNDPCPLQQVAATGAPTTVTHTHYDADGNASRVEVSGAPIFDETGKVIQVIEVCRDITVRERAEAKLQATVTDLERFNRLAVGREERMMELKREVNEMARKAGIAPPYDLAVLRSVK